MRPGVRAPVLAALACAVALGVLLVVAYAVAPFPSFDALALNGLEALRGPVATPVLTLLTHTADPLPLALALGALSAAGFAARRRRQVATAIVAVASANVATQFLKLALAHPRFHPVLAAQIEPAAFPSGHATAAMSLALAAVIVSTPRWRPVVAAAGCAYVLSLVTAILALGWHYPSDALGGLLVASGSAFGAVGASRALAGRESGGTSLESLAAYAPPRRAWAALAGAGALIALARAADLASFASVHTSAAAFMAFAAVACVALTIWASLLADS